MSVILTEATESPGVIWGLQPVFFFFSRLSIPGNAPQPLKWKSVLWADASTKWRHEVTHRLQPYTPRERTLGQIGRCIFEPYRVGLILTDLWCVTDSKPLFNKTISNSRSVIIDGDTTVREFHCYLYLWGLSIQYMHSFKVQHGAVGCSRKATPEHVQETHIFQTVGAGNNQLNSPLRDNKSYQVMNRVLRSTLYHKQPSLKDMTAYHIDRFNSVHLLELWKYGG